jgi:hypothetical protein
MSFGNPTPQTFYDSRDEDVLLDYNNLIISCPLYAQGGISVGGSLFTTGPTKTSNNGVVTFNIAGPNNIITFTTTPSHSYVLNFTIIGYCTASTGANVNTTFYQQIITKIINVASTLTLTTISSTGNGPSGYGITSPITTSGNTFTIQMGQPSTDTVRYTYDYSFLQN